MKKILIITNHSCMLYQFRRELIDALSEKFNITLSMPFIGHEDDFIAKGYKCINTEIDRRGINPGTDIKLLLDYAKIIKTEKPEKVITYSIKPNIYAGLVCRLKKIPYYVNIQGLGSAFHRKSLAKIVTIMYKTALKKSEAVLFENYSNADEFRKRKIITDDKIHVLNGAGVNLQFYHFKELTASDSCRFLFVGRIMKEKGVDELFNAIIKLKKEFGEKVHLDVIGFFEDEYKEIVEQLQAEGVVNYMGFQSDTRPFYSDCDCVVLPSYHEGMSNVLLEAEAMGRPVITSCIPGCMEAVDDEITGLLVKPHDADDLYTKMKKFISFSSEEKLKMGVNARKKAENEFDKKNIVNDTLKVILGA